MRILCLVKCRAVPPRLTFLLTQNENRIKNVMLSKICIESTTKIFEIFFFATTVKVGMHSFQVNVPSKHTYKVNEEEFEKWCCLGSEHQYTG